MSNEKQINGYRYDEAEWEPKDGYVSQEIEKLVKRQGSLLAEDVAARTQITVAELTRLRIKRDLVINAYQQEVLHGWENDELKEREPIDSKAPTATELESMGI